MQHTRSIQNREPRLAVFLLYLIAGVFIVSSIFSCGKKSEETSGNKLPDDIYSLELLKDRKEKDLHFLASASSPLPPADQEHFKELRYFPPNRDFIFRCIVQRHPSAREFTIQTSKNKPRRMINIGFLAFTHHETEYKLQLYAPKDTTGSGMYYFLPFKDATNGKETYGAGRFLDFDDVKSDTLFLDFNYAYNPYCAYNDRYDCPIPPVENHLPIEILAGEKAYGAHH